MAKDSLGIYVLFRFSTKTGKIDTTMTSMGKALMKMWALNNTTKTKTTLIFERESGKCVFACRGTDNFPEIAKPEKLGKCDEYGIALADLHEITDDRFDN